ncbi:MAG TPA: hypothetical protein VIF09_21065 [Polyangiaceae bacterium]
MSWVVLAVPVVAFATLVTVHITLAMGLTRRLPRWRGVVALFVAPLAPWWGWKARMRLRAACWIMAALVYGVTVGMSLAG